MIESNRMSWEGHVPCMGDIKNATKFLAENTKGRLGRRRRRWEDNIKIDFKGIV
jgi:hypothetical protein